MQNARLSSQFQKLRDLFAKADAACGADFEMRSHWAKYLCVLSAGFLENAISEVYGDFVRGAASQPVADYAMSTLSRIQNPKTSRFLEIARQFKTSWADALENFADSSGRREAINSIMANRHEIAHGKHPGITLVQIKYYLDRAVEVVEFIEKQCTG
jgi:RiboL-PSP-HEPN